MIAVDCLDLNELQSWATGVELQRPRLRQRLVPKQPVGTNFGDFVHLHLELQKAEQLADLCSGFVPEDPDWANQPQEQQNLLEAVQLHEAEYSAVQSVVELRQVQLVAEKLDF